MATEKVPYVGIVKVSFENRMCFVGALVLVDEVFLEVVPMELRNEYRYKINPSIQWALVTWVIEKSTFVPICPWYSVSGRGKF